MRRLAPDILRQRLLIEGFYTVPVDRKSIERFFATLTDGLGLRMYGEPVIFSPGGLGKEENQGFDAFVPLIDSGISLYVWANAQFLSCVVYTCKTFDAVRALEITREFFGMTEIESESF